MGLGPRSIPLAPSSAGCPASQGGAPGPSRSTHVGTQQSFAEPPPQWHVWFSLQPCDVGTVSVISDTRKQSLRGSRPEVCEQGDWDSCPQPHIVPQLHPATQLALQGWTKSPGPALDGDRMSTFYFSFFWALSKIFVFEPKP